MLWQMFANREDPGETREGFFLPEEVSIKEECVFDSPWQAPLCSAET